MKFLLNEIVKFYDIENDATEYNWEDTKLLQDAFLAIVDKQYAGKGSFVISGCEVDANDPTSAAISAGLVYLDTLNSLTSPPTAAGKIFKFGGASGLNFMLAPIYYLSANVSEDGKWINRNLTFSSSEPVGAAKIEFRQWGHGIEVVASGDFSGTARFIRMGNMVSLRATITITGSVSSTILSIPSQYQPRYAKTILVPRQPNGLSYLSGFEYITLSSSVIDRSGTFPSEVGDILYIEDDYLS